MKSKIKTSYKYSDVTYGNRDHQYISIIVAGGGMHLNKFLFDERFKTLRKAKSHPMESDGQAGFRAMLNGQ
jgi:hypothetical protein